MRTDERAVGRAAATPSWPTAFGGGWLPPSSPDRPSAPGSGSADPSSARRPGPGPGVRWADRLSERPTSTFLYGRSRPLVNLLLYALAEKENAGFHWLDIRTPQEESEELDPAQLGWIDEKHLWKVDRLDAFTPNNVPANAALFELVRDDEPPETLARLSDFLRLPDAMQQILAEPPAGGGPGVLAVANAHRTADAFPVSTLAPILEALRWAGYSLLVGFAGSPPAVRAEFDRVIRVDGSGPGTWTTAELVLEAGPSMVGLASEGTARLVDLPFVARVLRRALPGP
jgi:hypothetical protein